MIVPILQRPAKKSLEVNLFQFGRSPGLTAVTGVSPSPAINLKLLPLQYEVGQATEITTHPPCLLLKSTILYNSCSEQFNWVRGI